MPNKKQASVYDPQQYEVAGGAVTTPAPTPRLLPSMSDRYSLSRPGEHVARNRAANAARAAQVAMAADGTGPDLPQPRYNPIGTDPATTPKPYSHPLKGTVNQYSDYPGRAAIALPTPHSASPYVHGQPQPTPKLSTRLASSDDTEAAYQGHREHGGYKDMQRYDQDSGRAFIPRHGSNDQSVKGSRYVEGMTVPNSTTSNGASMVSVRVPHTGALTIVRSDTPGLVKDGNGAYSITADAFDAANRASGIKETARLKLAFSNPASWESKNQARKLAEKDKRLLRNASRYNLEETEDMATARDRSAIRVAAARGAAPALGGVPNGNATLNPPAINLPTQEDQFKASSDASRFDAIPLVPTVPEAPNPKYKDYMERFVIGKDGKPVPNPGPTREGAPNPRDYDEGDLNYSYVDAGTGKYMDSRTGLPIPTKKDKESRPPKFSRIVH